MTDFQTTRIKKTELQLLKTGIHRFLSLPLYPAMPRLEKLCSLGCLIDKWAFISRLRRSKAVLPWTTISNGMSETKKRKATNARDRSFLAAFDWIEPRKKETSERKRRMGWCCAPLIVMLILIQMTSNGSNRIYSVKKHYLPKDDGSLVSVFKQVLNRDRSLAVDR